MKIISFGWTSEALLAGVKTVTRRDWKPSFVNQWSVGDQAQAWDKNPRAGGKRIGTIEMTEPLTRQPTSSMTAQDYIDEGFEWMEANGLYMPAGSPWAGLSPAAAFDVWQGEDVPMWVVRFRVVGTT